jgi:pimeloyl-ACP methyl ester carboxylesterase
MSFDRPAAGRSFFFSARDGLRLHARCYDAPGSRRSPVLCLAGLTRNGRDFHDLAMALSSGPDARAVWALDSRGRGLSEHDREWRNYALPVEMLDAIDLATIAGLHGASIVGSSRGGLIAMLMAAAQPTIIGAVVLNDIGPVIERDGLARIAGYVSRLPLPANWEQAGELVANMSRVHFPDIAPQTWVEVARAWFNEKDGRPAPGYDPAIGRSIPVTAAPIPALWPQFLALQRVPVLVVRGSNSDILSEATQAEMQRRHPDCAAMSVPDQGHAPLLKDARTIDGIAAFLAAADAGEKVSGRIFGKARTG